MVRPIKQSDISSLKTVLENCNLFPSIYLDDMISDYLENESSEHIWFTYEHEGEIASIAFCAPMQLTNGTFNLYAIGIHNEYQRKGIGTQMMKYIENFLLENGHRILIVETSSTEDQIGARNFYLKCGYSHEATIKDFWDDGDDKIVFWKKLN